LRLRLAQVQAVAPASAERGSHGLLR
jgi:hypothetical protein